MHLLSMIWLWCIFGKEVPFLKRVGKIGWLIIQTVGSMVIAARVKLFA